MPTAITLAEFQRLRAAGALVVEALGPDFYADAHIPGAVSVPASRVEHLAATIAATVRVPVVVYGSRSCDQAVFVADSLEQAGVSEVHVYCGGKEEWVELGLPVDRA